MKIKVMTWNIASGTAITRGLWQYLTSGWKLALPWPKKRIIEKISEVIKKNSPDIVGLQEIDNGSLRSLFLDQAKAISHISSMKEFFSQPDFAVKAIVRQGNALLAKHRIIHKEQIRLPYFILPRSCLKARIRIAGRDIVFMNTHLSSEKNKRKKQFSVLKKDFIKEKSPLILMGDLNTTPHSPAFMKFRQDTGLGSTSDIIKKGTFFSWQPDYHYDYILFSKHFRVRKAVVMDDMLSDHLAVKAELEL